MTDEQITTAVAELDGWQIDVPFEQWKHAILNDKGQMVVVWNLNQRTVEEAHQDLVNHACRPYLASRDATMPVIEKQSYHTQIQFVDFLQVEVNEEYDGSDYADIKAAIKLLLATPRQLCIALLKATGKWKE